LQSGFESRSSAANLSANTTGFDGRGQSGVVTISGIDKDFCLQVTPDTDAGGSCCKPPT